MAGTCEQAIPATILAMFALRSLCSVLVSVALGTAASREHHLRVSLLGHTGHHARHVLKRQTVAECDLDGVVDVAAGFEHAQPIALEHAAALLRRQGKAVEIGRFVVLEAVAVLRLVERHAKHVQGIADAAPLGIVDVGAGYAVVVMESGHAISAGRISCLTMSRITSIALRISGPFGRCAEVAMDSEVLSTGLMIGLTEICSAHGVDLRAFIGSTPYPWPCRTRSITAGMHSISWATRILRSTFARAFSTDMRMACGRLGMMSG